MTEAMPFLQKYDITFLRPPGHSAGAAVIIIYIYRHNRQGSGQNSSCLYFMESFSSI